MKKTRELNLPRCPKCINLPLQDAQAKKLLMLAMNDGRERLIGWRCEKGHRWYGKAGQ